jgi:hypothetical protein
MAAAADGLGVRSAALGWRRLRLQLPLAGTAATQARARETPRLAAPGGGRAGLLRRAASARTRDLLARSPPGARRTPTRGDAWAPLSPPPPARASPAPCARRACTRTRNRTRACTYSRARARARTEPAPRTHSAPVSLAHVRARTAPAPCTRARARALPPHTLAAPAPCTCARTAPARCPHAAPASRTRPAKGHSRAGH